MDQLQTEETDISYRKVGPSAQLNNPKLVYCNRHIFKRSPNKFVMNLHNKKYKETTEEN